MEKVKRTLAMFLAVAMLCSMLPVSVFAAEDTAAPIESSVESDRQAAEEPSAEPAAIPENGSGDQGNTETGAPAQGNTETGAPAQGNTETGAPAGGNTETGAPTEGNTETGAPTEGNTETGAPTEGNTGTGTQTEGNTVTNTQTEGDTESDKTEQDTKEPEGQDNTKPEETPANRTETSYGASGSLSAQITWLDKDIENAVKTPEARPSSEDYAAGLVVYVSVDGGEPVAVTADNYQALGLETLPVPAVTAADEFHWAVEVNGLPESRTVKTLKPIYNEETGTYEKDEEGNYKYAVVEELTTNYSFSLGLPASVEGYRTTARAEAAVTYSASYEVKEYPGNNSLDYTVSWLDNHNEEHTNVKDRPTQAVYQEGLKLYVTMDGGERVQITEENYSEYGFEAMPEIPVGGDEDKWTIRVSSLPQKRVDKTLVPTGVNEAGEYIYEEIMEKHEEHTYVFAVDHDDVEGYETTRKTPSPNGRFYYTAYQNWNANVIWYDNGDLYEARPATGIYTVYRYIAGEGKDTAVPVEVSISSKPVMDSTGNYVTGWMLHLDDAVAYKLAENGVTVLPYVYYLRQEDEISLNKNVGEYSVLFNNTNNYSNEEEALYIDGTATELLHNLTDVTVNKIWEDGETPAADRPNCTMYLYRVTEKILEDGTIGVYTSEVNNASPVQGWDSAPVPKSGEPVEMNEGADIGELVTVTFGIKDGLPVLPMYDNTGHKYIYFVLENGAGGDYTVRVLNEGSTERAKVKEIFSTITRNGQVKFLLNGGTIVNDRENVIGLSATKIFKAQSMQTMTETAVQYKLQVRVENGEWRDATEADVVSYEDNTELSDGKVVITISGFQSEAMEQTASGPKVNKYDVNTGARLSYRWVEVAMRVNGGEWTDVTSTADGEEIQYEASDAGIVGPGIDSDKTTAYFTPETQSEDTIVNTLSAERRIVIEKRWFDADGKNISSDVGEDGKLESVYVTFRIDRDDGASTQNGSLTDRDGNVIAEGGLTLNGQDYNEDLDAWVRILDNLERYDENGREYTYTITEGEVTDPHGERWSSKLEFSFTVVDEDSGDRIVQQKAVVNNSIGPGDPLVFDVEKNWLDDGDLLSRVPVHFAIYRQSEDGNWTQVGESHELSTENGWYQRIFVTRADDSDTVNNYVVVEVDAGGVPVSLTIGDYQELQYHARAAVGQGYTDSWKVGTITETTSGAGQILEYNYLTYLEERPVSLEHTRYTLTNQIVGTLTLELNKSWTCGGAECPDATFALYMDGAQVNIADLGVAIEPADSVTLNEDGTVTLIGSEAKLDNQTYKAQIKIKDLPKYFESGAQHKYVLVETKIAGAVIENGVAQVSGDRYVASISLSKTTIVGRPGHHTGDYYTWNGYNVRQEYYTLDAYKVWQDDGTALNDAPRPDVAFKLYRVSVQGNPELEAAAKSGNPSDLAAALAGVSGELIAGDHFWNTKHNDWFWSCDLGSVERYDKQGYVYIYYIKENYNGAQRSYKPAYCNEPGLTPVENPAPAEGKTAITTREVFAWSGKEHAGEAVLTILSDGIHGGTSFGQYYSRTVVNYREDVRTISGAKLWELPEGWSLPIAQRPQVTVHLWASETQIPRSDKITYTEEELNAIGGVNTGKSATMQAKYSYSFDNLARYDEYGRTIWYYLTEEHLPNYKGQVTFRGNYFTLKNTYTFEENPHVEITVTKDWSSSVAGKTAIAPAHVTLYARMQNADGSWQGDPIKMAEATLLANDAGQVTYTFKNYRDTENLLPYLGANDLPLVYWIEEDATNGYHVTIDTGTQDVRKSGDIALTQNGENYTGATRIANDYWGDCTSASLSKAWEKDNGLLDNTSYRTSGLVFTLYRSHNSVTVDGQTIGGEKDEAVKVITLNAENNWSYSEKNLPKYAPNGQPYSYTFSHDGKNPAQLERASVEAENAKLQNYTATFSNNKVTNKLKTVDIRFSKTWKTDDGKTLSGSDLEAFVNLGVLPASISFVVQRSENGSDWSFVPATKDSSGSTVTLGSLTGNGETTPVLGKTYQTKDSATASGSWNNMLPECPSGSTTPYQYRVVELMTWKDGSRTWYYGGDAAQLGPNGSPYEKLTASVSGTSAFAFTNTVPVIRLQLIKGWVDYSNRDNTRPASLTLSLSSTVPSGNNYVGPSGSQTLKQATDASDANGNLTKNQVGDYWATVIATVPMPANYLSGDKAQAVNALYQGSEAEDTITNANYTKTAETLFVLDTSDNVWKYRVTNTLNNIPRVETSISAEKVFDGDTLWADITRSTVRFELYYQLQGNAVETKETGWTKITDANKANFFADPNEAAAKVVEIGENGTGSVSWSKLWRYLERNAGNAGQAREIYYAVQEVLLDEYGQEVARSDYQPTGMPNRNTTWTRSTAGGVSYSETITNKFTPANLTLKKTWADQAGHTFTQAELESAIKTGAIPAQLTVALYYTVNGGAETNATAISADLYGEKTFSVTALTGGVTAYTGLPPVDHNGNKITYTIKEVSYTFADGTVVAADKATGINNGRIVTATAAEQNNALSATLTNSVQTTDLSVNKVWVDGEEQDGTHPTTITVLLLADGTQIGSYTLKASESWQHTFEHLPVFKNGSSTTAIQYTVKEQGETAEHTIACTVTRADGSKDTYDYAVTYTKTENGYTITNTHIPEVVELSGEKKWNDGEEQDGAHPDYVVVNLLADGQKTQEAVVRPGENKEWKFSFTGLPKYKAGKAIVYTVEEAGVQNGKVTLNGVEYSVSVTKNSDGSFTVTNTHTPAVTRVEVTKTWDDENNRDGLRKSYSITLYKTVNTAKSVVEAITLDKDTLGKTWEKLPVYEKGAKITYTVEETGVPEGYTPTITPTQTENGWSFAIVNQHTPARITVSGVKTWDDSNEQDGLHPESIRVILLANNKELRTETVSPDKNGKWSFTFADLYKFENGSEITYSVKESGVGADGTVVYNKISYNVKVTEPEAHQFTITNKHEPKVLSVSAEKTFDDNSDQARPAEIQVQLLANGVAAAADQSGTALTNPVSLSKDNNWKTT